MNRGLFGQPSLIEYFKIITNYTIIKTRVFYIVLCNTNMYLDIVNEKQHSQILLETIIIVV